MTYLLLSMKHKFTAIAFITIKAQVTFRVPFLCFENITVVMMFHDIHITNEYLNNL